MAHLLLKVSLFFNFLLCYVHQLVANYVCLLFGAEQVVYRGFLELFH